VELLKGNNIGAMSACTAFFGPIFLLMKLSGRFPGKTDAYAVLVDRYASDIFTISMDIIANVDDARDKIDQWRRDYNEFRPHSSLRGMSPSEYTRQLQAAEEDQESTLLARSVFG